MSRDKTEQEVEQKIAALKKWQEETGINLIEIRDPNGEPTYDENGSRVREFNVGGLYEKLNEIMKRAKADPVYGISPEAAMRKAAKAAAEKTKCKK